MAVTQYIGARYVPLFADPIEWTDTRTYEPLTIVLYQGNSFTSKQYVPRGISIDNEDFWAETGNYNGQIEQYRRDVALLADTVQDGTERIEYMEEIIPSNAFTPEHTMLDRINGIARPNNYYPINFIGRIYFEEANAGKNAAACTFVDDSLIVFVSNDVDTSDGDLYVISVGTNEVTQHLVRPFGHCNGMDYCTKDNRIYVVPSTIYPDGSAVQTDDIFIVSSTTFNILDRVTLNFHPHSIAYNADNDVFYVKEWLSNGCRIHTMSYDFQTELAVNTYVYSDYIDYGASTFGYQNDMCYHNGELFIQLSSSVINSLFVIDTATMNFGRAISMSIDCGLFVATEGEGLAVSPNGTFFAFSNVGMGLPFGAIYTIALLGNSLVMNYASGESYDVRGLARIHQASNPNAKIFYTGSNTDRYPTFIEGYLAASKGFRHELHVHGNYTLLQHEIGILPNVEGISIYIESNTVLTIDASLFFDHCNILGVDRSGNYTSVLHCNITSGNAVIFRDDTYMEYLGIDFTDVVATYNAPILAYGPTLVMRFISNLNVGDTGYDTVNAQQRCVVITSSGATAVTVRSNNALKIFGTLAS